MHSRARSYARTARTPAKFAVGDRVRAKNINPATHTRLPRYARGHLGVVEAIRGCHVFPDSTATGVGEDPHWLYTVVFDRPGALGAAVRSDAHGVDRGVGAISGRRMTDPAATTQALAAVRDIPRDGDGPVFREPWEAQAFALALSLQRRGVFTWSEWAQRLGEEIKRAQAAGDPDTGETYYRHWLATLERIVAEKGVTDRVTLARYHDAWDHAADRTPHGMPIELSAEDFS